MHKNHVAVKFLNFSKKYFFGILTLSVLFVMSSVFWTSDTVYPLKGERQARLGFPINFFVLNQPAYDGDYPPGAVNGVHVELPFSMFIWALPFLMYLPIAILFAAVLFSDYSNISDAWGMLLSVLILPALFLDVIVAQVALSALLFYVYSSFHRTRPFFRFLTLKYILGAVFLAVILLMLTVKGFTFVSSKINRQTNPGMYLPPPMPIHVDVPTPYPSLQ